MRGYGLAEAKNRLDFKVHNFLCGDMRNARCHDIFAKKPENKLTYGWCGDIFSNSNTIFGSPNASKDERCIRKRVRISNHEGFSLRFI